MKKTLSILLVALALMAGYTSCKKDKPVVVPVDLGPNQLNDNVFIVDSAKWRLRSYINELAQGIYRYALTPNTPYVEIPVGSIIIGKEGDGYIRKVVSVSVNSYDMILSTVPADFTDVFKMGTYSFQVDMNDMKPGVPSTGFSHSFTNKVIYKDGARSVSIPVGHVDMNPTWNFVFGFDSVVGINKFEMTTKNFDFNSDFTMNVIAPTSLSLQDREYSLATYTKKSIRWLPVGRDSIPVVVVMTADIVAAIRRVQANLTIGQGGTVSVSTSSKVDLGMSYNNGVWSDIYNSSPTKTLLIDSISGRQNEWIHISLMPRISVKICGKPCPEVTIGAEQSLYKQLVLGTTLYGDWDLSSHTWLGSSVGVTNTTILGKNVPLYSQYRASDSISYFSPVLATLASGGGQFGSILQPLANPVKIKITDSYGVGQSEIPVYFAIVTGGGSLSSPKVFTDQNGEAEVNWTLGSLVGTQTIRATVFKGNNQLISGVPMIISATAQ